MKRFFCECGQEVYFENTYCGACGGQLGFDPQLQDLVILQSRDNTWQAQTAKGVQLYRSCSHRHHEIQCNWLLPEESSATQCVSCAMTRTIPILTIPENMRRWQTLESSKRRMIYGLLRLKLPLVSTSSSANQLVFDFLEDKRTNPEVSIEHVLSGHSNGIITLNAAEADASYREATKQAMNEPYRTLLGHFRHEVGHFYWDQLIQDTSNYDGFNQLFGNEAEDYRGCLDQYYQNGPMEGWQQNYISAYASAHPLEDWAETWAHYLLMMETLETAISYGLIDGFESEQLSQGWMIEWVKLVVALNALNRSMGHSDAYPFVVSETVQGKLKFVHDLIARS
jgi:hypothetical protein